MSFASQYTAVKIIELPQGLFVIPMVDALIEEMSGSISYEAIDGFEYLNNLVDTAVALASQHGPVAYAEVFLSAGEGDQLGIMWENGIRTRVIAGEEVINSVFKQLGVVAYEGLDEFLTIGLGFRRFTKDWVED